MLVCVCVVLLWSGINGIVILMFVFVVVFLMVVVLLRIMRLVNDICFLLNMFLLKLFWIFFSLVIIILMVLGLFIF